VPLQTASYTPRVPPSPLLRIIDANTNRAREALRVMEDAARFGLDHAPLAETLKAIRHDLRAAIDTLAAAGIDRTALLTSRDTPGDVGASISTPAESDRDGLIGIALAAGGRLTEALRAIEESVKALGEGADHRPFESLRYRAYTAEKDLALALANASPGARPCPQWRLCILLTESLCTHHPWQEVARQAIVAGADCIQLREKDLPDRELLARARSLVELARTTQSSVLSTQSMPSPAVIINDRPDIALLAGADGIHLGQDDLPIAEVRTLARAHNRPLWIGLSTTNLVQARAAAKAGADYCGLGPMFPTTTKHKPTLAGPAYLHDYLADPNLSARPHLAIGGITPDNAAELWTGGCRGIAVSSAVCSAKSPAQACERLLAAMRTEG
jgi:thiamine-phosphate pyrophosphorylase